MPETLDYARPQRSREARWPARLARLTFCYPALMLAGLYGEWLLAWAILGHRPRPSLDDPKFIDGSTWIHLITGLLLAGMLPVMLVSMGAVVFHVLFNHVDQQRGKVWLFIAVVIWGAGWATVVLDPLGVLYWWLD